MTTPSPRVRRSLARGAFGALLLAGIAGGVGCSSGPRPVVPARDLGDPAAGVRAQAVQEVARRRDLSQVPTLIELLDDPDPGVRVMAGATLRDLTGHDTGYDASARPSVRRDQVEQWRAWWGARSAGPAPAGVVR